MNLKKDSIRRLLPFLLIGVGLVAGRATLVGGASEAHAAATAMPPLDRLVAEDEIRQKMVLYTLLADGSGEGGKPRDMRALAEDLMTPDVVSEIHPINGAPVKTMTGREHIIQTPKEQPDPALAGRHYIVGTYFDDISATIAHTRATALYFDVTRNLMGADCNKAAQDACGGRVVKGVMWIYEMTWTKTPEGWKISKNTLRDDS